MDRLRVRVSLYCFDVTPDQLPLFLNRRAVQLVLKSVERPLCPLLQGIRPRQLWNHFPILRKLRLDPDKFSQDLREAQKKAEQPYACLDFRHTFGTQLAMKGESLYQISALMGNSPEICRRHYAALVPEALTDTVEFSNPTRVVASRDNLVPIDSASAYN